MRTIFHGAHIGSIILFLLAQACTSRSIPPPQTKAKVIRTRHLPTDTSSPTTTPRPAEATLTEFARQAEGTRQVLVDTQVALEQNADATALSATRQISSANIMVLSCSP
jgi:hypothetical protein